MESVLTDLRYALRTLARTPTFTLIALVTLGIGTGANVTVFSFVSALLFRPAPGVADPRSLVAVYTSDYSSGPYGDTSYPDFLSLATETSTFAQLAAEYDNPAAVIRTDNTVDRGSVSAVTGTYFDVLGVQASAGRLLTERDTAPSAPPVAVVGHAFWRRALRGANVLGTTVTIGGRAYTIVGVASERFVGLGIGRAVELWTPYLPEPATPDERGNRGLSVVGRLRGDVDLRRAQAEIDALARRLAQTYPRTNMGTLAAPNAPRPIIVVPHTRMPPAFRPEVGMIGAVIMAATALVLLMACANIASLVLSRATSRSREIAIRLALGAARARIVRQLVTESLLLGVAGGGLGLLMSLWTTDVLPSFFPAEQAAMLDARIDTRAFAFAALVSIASSLLFGLAPALHAVRPSAREALRGDSGRISDGRTGRQLRRGLVVAQVGMAVVLLTSAVLLVQSVSRAMHADLGFATRDGVVATMDLPGTDFTPAQRRLFFAGVSERVGAMPGVLAAGLCRALPLSGGERRGFRPEGYTARPGEDQELNFNVVDAAYFSALQLPLLAGRLFGAEDAADGLRVAIVNDALAARYFAGDAVGKRLTDSSGTRLEIIGVVRTARHRSVQEPPTPIVYYALSQTDSTHISVVVRTSGEPSALVEPVRRAIRDIDRGVPVFGTITLSSLLSAAIAGDRLTASLVAVCGGMALLLALIGVYGVIAYSVVRRAREIGVRVALGARPRHVVRLVLSEGWRVTLTGIALGLAGSWIAGRQLGSMLYDVNVSNPLTYVLVAAAFGIVSTVAGLGPTARALAVEPVSVLRQE